MVWVFPFRPRTKHKTLHVKQAWAELENFVEKNLHELPRSIELGRLTQ